MPKRFNLNLEMEQVDMVNQQHFQQMVLLTILGQEELLTTLIIEEMITIQYKMMGIMTNGI